MKLVFKCNIDVSKQSINEMAVRVGLSWVNPRIDDDDYPLSDAILGEWNVEVLCLQRRMMFEEILREIRKDGWRPASVHHLLTLFASGERIPSGSFLAPGSFCVDDFECLACVILSVDGNDKKLGLGNWRGSKIDGKYCVVRVRRF